MTTAAAPVTPADDPILDPFDRGPISCIVTGAAPRRHAMGTDGAFRPPSSDASALPPMKGWAGARLPSPDRQRGASVSEKMAASALIESAMLASPAQAA